MSTKPKQQQAADELAQVPEALPPMLQVFGWLLDGQSKGAVLDAIVKLFPKEDPAKLLKEAQQSFALISTEDRGAILGWCMEATRELYRQLKQVGDYEGALRAVAQLHKLAETTTK